MKVRDITDAIADDDRPTMRQAFCLLVDPTGGTVAAPSPGFLIVALNRLCAALADDPEPMPQAVCLALNLGIAAAFGQGAVAAKRDWTRLSLRLAQTS